MKLDFEETRDLWKTLGNFRHLFEKGGKLEKLYPLWEANESFLFITGQTTKSKVHVRDSMDIKRLMSTVIIALIP